MTEERLEEFLNSLVNQNNEDVIGYIASNYINIGGGVVGLTVANASKAIRFALEYNKKHSLTSGDADP